MSMSNGAIPDGAAREEATHPNRAFLYLTALILGPLLMLLSAFFVIPTQWFILHSKSTYLANTGYGASLSGKDCQILVYGDSTAMVGLDPAVLQERTGLSACNIAEFAGMTFVNKTLLLDMFLRHNPRPRFIVFMFAPDNMADPYSWDRLSIFEAVYFRLRYGRDKGTVRLLASHPVDTLTWAERGMRMVVLNGPSAPFPAETAHLREPFNGRFRMRGDAERACHEPPEYVVPATAWIDQLRSEYAVDGTTVIFDVAPLPDCDKANPWLAQHFSHVVDDSPLPTLPITSFLKNSGLHLTDVGSRQISIIVAAQVEDHRKAGTAATMHSRPDAARASSSVSNATGER